nr:MAG TPA: hypothetical protein [Caudoviricetes sp.]
MRDPRLITAGDFLAQKHLTLHPIECIIQSHSIECIRKEYDLWI